MLVKYLRPVELSADLNMKLLFNHWIWFGASYPNEDAIVWMGGINFDNLFQISYAYDMPNTTIGP
jgi:hypothetical protein